MHFRGRFEIQLRHISHPVFVLDHFAGADAHHHVVRFVIAPAQKMNIVRSNKSDTDVPGNLRQDTIAQALLFHAVIVHFHEEILRAKNVAVFGGALSRFLQIVRLNCAIDFPRKATAQPDQPRCMRRQKLFIDPGGIMKSIQVRCRNQLYEVAIAGFVPRQKRKVVCRIAPRCRSVLMRTGGHISFATNDRFYPGALRFLVKFNRAKQIAVIRDRDGRHLVFSRLFHQLFHPDTAIQQRIFSVQMEVNERIARH